MNTIWHALSDGAPFSFINVAVLAFVLGITVERFVFILTRYRVNAPEFMAQVRKLVQAGNIDRAIKLCEAAPLPLLQVVKAGLTQVNRGEDAVIASMEERLAEVLPELEKRIGSLWSLANIATLIGLVGTVFGLISTFGAIAAQGLSAADKQRMLSNGIAEAMYNTAFGLLIAVICMIAHVILHTRAKAIAHDLEALSERVFNLLTVTSKPGGY